MVQFHTVKWVVRMCFSKVSGTSLDKFSAVKVFRVLKLSGKIIIPESSLAN
jgi:hypothetical protein